MGGFRAGIEAAMGSGLLSWKETWRLCVSTGEEVCLGLKRACTLDCPFGFLTDVHNCELCQCRPRPKKCRPTMCDKFCPLGFLYVFVNIFFVNSEIKCNLLTWSCLCWELFCMCLNEPVVVWFEESHTVSVREFRKKQKSFVSKCNQVLTFCRTVLKVRWGSSQRSEGRGYVFSPEPAWIAWDPVSKEKIPSVSHHYS